MVAALVMYSTVKEGVLGGNLQKSLVIIKRIRPMMIAQNILVQAVVLFVAFQLNTLPIFGWGWWQLLDSGTGAGGQNATIAVTSLPFVGPVFMLILFLALPRLAGLEEEIFREGTPNWKSGFKRSILFGLVHCMVGVSLGVGFALSIAGLWFTRQYFKGGAERSTAYHAAWNLSIVSLLAISMLIS